MRVVSRTNIISTHSLSRSCACYSRMCGVCGPLHYVSLLRIHGACKHAHCFHRTWAEVCAPGTRLSRVRTEITWVPMVIIFQLSESSHIQPGYTILMPVTCLVAAVVITTNTISSVCFNPSWLFPSDYLRCY